MTMARTRPAYIALGLLAATSCHAADTYPILVYPAPTAATAPKVDGVLDDAAWRDAPVVSGFIWYNSADKVPVQTSFRVCYDDRYLYFGVNCDEPRMDLLTVKPVPKDSMEVFQTEAIELFIEPAHGEGDYFQVAANAAGSVYDSHRTEQAWDSGTRAETSQGRDGWTLEIAIPWANLGVAHPRSGSDIGFNVCRDRLVGNAREWSCWAQVASNFHDPMHFANLVLSPTPEQLGALGPELRKGDRGGPVVIFSSTGFAKTSYKMLAEGAIKRMQSVVDELVAVGKAERDASLAAEIDKRLAPVQQALSEYAHQAQAGEIDAAAWARMDGNLARMSSELAGVVWEARLSALLAGI